MRGGVGSAGLLPEVLVLVGGGRERAPCGLHGMVLPKSLNNQCWWQCRLFSSESEAGMGKRNVL